jgi:hypothetical protein
MQFLKQALWLIVFLSCAVSAEPLKIPPDFTFPGNSIAEKEIRWTWYQLPTYLQACYFSQDCKLDSDQRKLIAQISANVGHYSQATIQFVSEKDRPDLFKSDAGEVHRTVVTGNSPESPIYINTDRMTQNGQSLGFSFWAGLLTHELVHHLGIKDDERRIPDLLGAAVAQAFEKSVVTIGLPDPCERYAPRCGRRFMCADTNGRRRVRFADSEGHTHGCALDAIGTLSLSTLSRFSR